MGPMVPHHIDLRTDHDGLPVVSIVYDLNPEQVDAALHALRTVRDARYRLDDISTDDALALRDMTSLIDELAVVVGGEGIARFHASVARLGVLRDGLDEFTAGRHLEREGDMAAHPPAARLLLAIADVHADAVRAALDGIAPAR